MRAVEVVDSSGSVSFRQMLTVLRRRYVLILALTLVGAAAGLFVAYQAPVTYQASAMLRLAGERQTITGDDEALPVLNRTADPMLSIMQLVRSRAVAGVVVDSLGLQLTSRTPEFKTEVLARVQVDPRAAGESVQLAFGEKQVPARRGERTVAVPYGQVVNLGIVQFVVPARPGVQTATLGIQPREQVIDWLTSSLITSRRDETDVIDVAFVTEDPRSAHKIVNTTVQAFQNLSVQWARERSRRRRERNRKSASWHPCAWSRRRAAGCSRG